MTLDFNEIVIETNDPKLFEFEDNSNYFTLATRKLALMIRSIAPYGYCNIPRYIDIFGFKSKNKPIYVSTGGIYVDRVSLNYEKEEMLKRHEENPNYLYEIVNKCEKDWIKIFKFTKKIKTSDLGKYSDDKIKELFIAGCELLTNLGTYLTFPHSIQSYLEENVMNGIKHSIKDIEKVQEYFNILTTTSKQNTSYFEQIGILKLAVLYNQKNKIDNELDLKIEEYLDNFGIIGVKNGVGEVWTKEEVIERIKQLSKENPRRKLNELLKLPEFQNDKADNLLIELKADKKFRDIVNVTRLYVYFRNLRTDAISQGFALMYPLFSEIARRNNLELSDIIECTPEEIATFKFPPKEIIKSRNENSIVRGIDGKLYYIYGNSAKIAIEKIEKIIYDKEFNFKNKDQIKGVIGNKGISKGRVKIVMNNKEFNKVERGDIIVAPMTTPDYVTILEKASAIITDEGGITSHASVISRELGIPSIIGTKIASRFLHDGDLVEVNANLGVVRILTRAK